MINKRVIINADDAGISLGVNNAIERMIKAGKLNSFSIFTNQIYTEDAIRIAKKNKNIDSGLHFNLTIGKSNSNSKNLKILTDKEGFFKNGFINLLIASILKKNEFETEVERELREQINYLQSNGIKISHIDGHRHIHTIPNIFNIVMKIAKEYKIERIRIINENIIKTIKTTKNIDFIFNSNLVKFLILKLFTFINTKNNNLKTRTYFFSILHSCKIDYNIIKNFKIPNGFISAEVMLHPGEPEIDKNDRKIKYEKDHLLSSDRIAESKISVLEEF